MLCAQGVRKIVLTCFPGALLPRPYGLARRPYRWMSHQQRPSRYLSSEAHIGGGGRGKVFRHAIGTMAAHNEVIFQGRTVSEDSIVRAIEWLVSWRFRRA